MLGEIVDRIAAITQLTGASIDESARRAVEIDTLQAAVNLDRFVCFSHLWPRHDTLELNMNPIERCFDTARGRHFKIVLPEGDDIRVLAAARGLIDREIARPVVLGASDAIMKTAAAGGIALDGIAVIDPRSDARTQ